MIRSRVLLASLLSLVLVGGSASVSAAEAARAILVMDASGSMWGQIEGQTKIEIARKVVRDLLQDWDPSVELGLTAYGHRRKGDCTDIETLVAPGSAAAGQIVAAVDGLNPKGKTPLSQAVVQAAQSLRYSEEKATVILVSDGEETCDRDPCQVGRELEQAGVDFTVHVIGFDVADQARSQLQCLAENTGGEFHLAQNAASLSQAMKRTVEIVREPKPVAAPVGPIIEAGCSFNANQIQGEVGSSHTVSCPAGCTGGAIWGTDKYTGDSRVCKAAIHAGLATSEGGMVVVTLGKGRPAYRGSLRNGIQSSDYGSYGKSYRMAAAPGVAMPALPPAPPPASDELIEAGCSFNANQIQGHAGTSHRVSCPAGCTGGAVWGSSHYTGDSAICKAGIHAGVSTTQGGTFLVTLAAGQPAYRGMLRNGIRSSDYGPYGKSYRLSADAGGTAAPTPAPSRSAPLVVSEEDVIEAGCSFNANQIHGEVGSRHVVSCPAGCTDGAIWGTGHYTGDSRICKAAIHAGFATPQGGGSVIVTLGKGRPAYRGSLRNGIQSSDYGSYGKSYSMEPVE